MQNRKKTFPLILSWILLAVVPSASAETSLTTVTVSSDISAAPTEISGFEDTPVRELPLSVKTVTDRQIREAGLRRLSDITLLEGSVTDSYNATGYWDYLSIRGFVLDNRTNFKREGLPINAQTSIPLDNKERLEILKGLSGVQSGAGSPGGMINYVVKRPTPKELREVQASVSGDGGFLTAADFGGRLSHQENIGYRVNLAYEHLRPAVDDSEGQRTLISFAHDWKVDGNTLVESELEWSRRSQPSQAAFSLLGTELPRPVDPRLNLNNQSWSEPVVFEGLTGTIRWTRKIGDQWTWTSTVGAQILNTDDRLAYPYGCSAEGNYDRYCSDGTFDMYDFRSDDERRTTYALRTSLNRKFQTGAMVHETTVGYLGHTAQERFEKQAYNAVGTGNVNGNVQLPADPSLTDENTNRDSGVSEVFAFNVTTWGAWRGWLGVRFSDIHRESVRTDGSRATTYSERFLLPWAAISHQFDQVMTYLSYGEGVETYVTPNRSGYTRPGQFVPDVVSRQWELGVRGDHFMNWGLAYFVIDRPVVEDQRPYFDIDGKALHQGIEMDLQKKWQRWELQMSGMWLQARREDSRQSPAINGLRPVNLPEHTLRAEVGHFISGLKGLRVHTRLSYEGSRAVTADNEITLPAWARWDLGASYQFGPSSSPRTVRFNLENVTDERYWKESPTQYGHIYLYPGAARTVSLTFQTPL